MEFSFLKFPQVNLKDEKGDLSLRLFTLYIDDNLEIKGLWFEGGDYELYDVLYLPNELKYDEITKNLIYPLKKPLEGPASREFAELVDSFGLDKYMEIDLFTLMDKNYSFENRYGKREKIKDLIIDVAKWRITKCVTITRKFLILPERKMRTITKAFKEDEKVVFKE